MSSASNKVVALGDDATTQFVFNFVGDQAGYISVISNVETHYFNAHRHPLSNKARQLGVDDVADELDNLFKASHRRAQEEPRRDRPRAHGR